jgi:transcriptional antiterminator RfaH
VEVFCPRLKYRKATRRGNIWWVEPLFPGYVLARFDMDKSERAVVYSQGVRGLVRFGGKIPTIPDNFVRSLQADIRAKSNESEDILSVSPVIQIGDEVEVAHGPLRGMKGEIVAIIPAAERVKVLLEFLGQPHAIDVDLFSLILPRRPTPLPPES